MFISGTTVKHITEPSPQEGYRGNITKIMQQCQRVEAFTSQPWIEWLYSAEHAVDPEPIEHDEARLYYGSNH